MKKLVSLCMMLFLCLGIYAQKSYQLLSPNGEIKMSISVSDKIYYDIAYGQETLLEMVSCKCNWASKCLAKTQR